MSEKSTHRFISNDSSLVCLCMTKYYRQNGMISQLDIAPQFVQKMIEYQMCAVVFFFHPFYWHASKQLGTSRWTAMNTIIYSNESHDTFA